MSDYYIASFRMSIFRYFKWISCHSQMFSRSIYFPVKSVKLDGQNSIALLYDVSFLVVLHATAFNMHCSRMDLDGNISSLSSFYFLPVYFV